MHLHNVPLSHVLEELQQASSEANDENVPVQVITGLSPNDVWEISTIYFSPTSKTIIVELRK